MKYIVIDEKTATGYSAYVPDLPGCIAVGDTFEDTKRLMRGALSIHLAGMRKDCETVPAPTTIANYISAA